MKRPDPQNSFDFIIVIQLTVVAPPKPENKTIVKDLTKPPTDPANKPPATGNASIIAVKPLTSEKKWKILEIIHEGAN
jgi:hypothetical protein